MWNWEVFLNWFALLYRQFSMLGFGGRRFFLSSTSLSQCNRWCSTVSYGYIQCLHMGANSGSILFLWKFRFTWPVLRRKMLHWSRLFSWLMGSFGFGLGWCWYKRLPLSSIVQLLCQVSEVFCLAICFAVAYVVLVFSWGMWEPIFANPSALSFMNMSEWPGIHCIVMLIL